VLVAALRETSIVFGTLIAAGLLKERVSPIRFVPIFIISTGAVAIKASWPRGTFASVFLQQKDEPRGKIIESDAEVSLVWQRA